MDVRGRLGTLRAHPAVRRVEQTWLGGTLLRIVAETVRVEIFDRSMTIAAQIFTSMLPLLIVTASILAGGDGEAVADLLGASGASSELIDETVSGAADPTIGVVGALLVLASATSLSRALTRAFAAVWEIARPHVSLRSAWRWLAAVIVFALAVLISQQLVPRVGVLPPRDVWPVALSFACDAGVALFVPWMLLAGVIGVRALAPGAIGFAVVMLAIRPSAAVWLPWALETSSERYGPIGIAFTYLAWLYVVAFVLLGTAIVGRAVVSPPVHDAPRRAGR